MIAAENQFYSAYPDVIMEAVEKCGWDPTGHYQQLNSYENRVFAIRLEDQPFEVIAKFYRPGRWSRAALLEEHQFLNELYATGIPVVAPLPVLLQQTHGVETVFFPKARGRIPPDFTDEDMEAHWPFTGPCSQCRCRKARHHRHTFNADMGWMALHTLKPIIPENIWQRYDSAASHIIGYLDRHLETASFSGFMATVIGVTFANRCSRATERVFSSRL